MGNGKLWTCPITGDRVEVGRDPTCPVSIPHASVSRRHAVISVGPPLTVQDLGSTNGTRVARDVLVGGAPAALELGESFHIGPFSLTVVDAGTARSASAPRTEIRIEDPTLAEPPVAVREIAASSATVLIAGETGVGKEVLAQRLHELSGRPGALVRVNCAAVAEALFESELFGHERGAFTGAVRPKPGLLEAANRGTVLLDEIGELTPALQAKLLRALEAREVTRVGAVAPVAIDVRFLAATHRNLVEDITTGRFRADLYYRIDGVSLAIAPLRERRRRIGSLARGFAGTAELTPAAVAQLEGHDWPGNVRELKAVVERAVILARGAAIAPEHLLYARKIPIGTEPPAESLDHLDARALDERARIVAALDAVAGNQTRAAKQLGMSRAILKAKLARYRIPRPRQ